MDTNSLLESVLYYLSSAIWTSEFNKDNSSNVNPAQNNGSEYTNDTFEMRAFDWIFDWDSGEMPEPITNLKLGRRKQFYYYDSARQKYRVVKKDSGIPSKSFNTSEEALHYVNTHREEIKERIDDEEI